MQSKFKKALAYIAFSCGLSLGLTLRAEPSRINRLVRSQAIDLNILREGDIIFIKSQSTQSPALREITKSEWTHVGVILRLGKVWKVAEAANGVEVSTLSSFVNKSRNKKYVVKRVKPNVLPMNSGQVAALKNALSRFYGDAYDIYFEWSDARSYCSELVFKAYERALQLEIGKVEVFGDLDLSGPLARLMIYERYTKRGKKLNLQEPIVTPISMLNSDLLDTVAAN